MEREMWAPAAEGCGAVGAAPVGARLEKPVGAALVLETWRGAWDAGMEGQDKGNGFNRWRWDVRKLFPMRMLRQGPG